MRIAAVLIVLSIVSAGYAEESVTVERNVEVKMRDGVLLRADIYRPSRAGKFPVLLYRTPYDKSGAVSFGLRGANQGYVIISQDVRGRYASDGDWYPFLHESTDGYDTVEWAASLPYSNGKVGMFGVSYDGATQMLAAIAHPPHLFGICPGVTASNYHDGWAYQGGAFEQWFDEAWTTGLSANVLARTASKAPGVPRFLMQLPLAQYRVFDLDPKITDLTASLAPHFRDWLAHPNYDEYWKRWSIEEHYPDIVVPAFTIAAWYDLFQGGSLRNYIGLKEHAGSEVARKNQRLLVIIGGHAGLGRKIGEVDFGPQAAKLDGSDLARWDWYYDLVLQWYDYLLKGVKTKLISEKPVRIFVMGINRWREEDDWPLKRAHTIKYYLHSDGDANSLKGNGALSTTSPASESADRYVYDPGNPTPSGGGPCCQQTGPRDQRRVEGRNDVLVYSTRTLTENLEVTGPVHVELYAKSSAPDTDFTAKLVDVREDGFAQNLTEGIIRARYRNSQERPELLQPGSVYKFDIDLWSTSNVFLKGHRLRLEISSSNFPRFSRNLNTGQDEASADKFTSAANVIYHDAEHPSVVLLPVVPSK